MRITFAKFLSALAFLFNSAIAYEINNHADMSQTAVLMSQLSDDSPTGKLFRLGLKPFQLRDGKQTFPLDNSLGPIPYCFGSERPFPFKVTTWALPSQLPGEEGKQPNWTLVGAPLTIAQMIRYGACYEDATEAGFRPFAHFYNPQNNGAPLTEAFTPLGPNSLHWMLYRNASNTLLTGSNHYTWPDARESFYDALTLNLPNATPDFNAWNRRYYWGKTFQALGHIVHHLPAQAFTA